MTNNSKRIQALVPNIIADFKAGINRIDLLEKYQIGKRTLGTIFEKNNVVKPRGYIEKQSDLIVQEYMNGKSSIQLAIDYDTTVATISKLLKRKCVITRNQTVTSRKYECNEHFFDNIDTEEKAYFLGFLYADGCNHIGTGAISLALNNKDTAIVERLNKLIFKDKPVNFYSNYATLSIHSTHMSKVLNSLGCTPQKTRTLQYPKWIKQELEHHFVRGYFDGDGSVYFNNNMGCLGVKIMASIDFCNSLSAILKNACCITSRIKKSYVQVGEIIFAGANVERFFNYMYKDATIYLERKYERFNAYHSVPIGYRKQAYYKEIYGTNIDIKARGSKNGSSKLNESKVILIMQEFINKTPYHQIASMFEVSKSAIESIKYGRTWSQITGFGKPSE